MNLNEKLKNKQKHHQYLQLKLYFYSLFRMLYIIKLIVKSEYGGHPSPRPIHHDSDSGGHHRPYPTRLYVCWIHRWDRSINKYWRLVLPYGPLRVSLQVCVYLVPSMCTPTSPQPVHSAHDGCSSGQITQRRLNLSIRPIILVMLHSEFCSNSVPSPELRELDSLTDIVIFWLKTILRV